MNYEEIKEDMRKAARRAYDIRLQSGDGGNLSVRIPGQELMLIKASGCSFGDMTDADIVLIDFSGKIVQGNQKPSREFMTHAAIYREKEDVEAIFHSHSPWSISVAQRCSVIPPVSLPLEMKIGQVPILDIGESHADAAVAEAAGKFVGEHRGIKCFIQKRHGLFSLAADIKHAEHNAELVEEGAQVAFLSMLKI